MLLRSRLYAGIVDNTRWPALQPLLGGLVLPRPGACPGRVPRHYAKQTACAPGFRTARVRTVRDRAYPRVVECRGTSSEVPLRKGAAGA